MRIMKQLQFLAFCLMMASSAFTFGVSGTLLFKDQRLYEQPSEESENVLQLPVDTVFDNEGNLYVLDASAKCIFVWNKQGKLAATLGREGEGPGEFIFRVAARSKIAYNGKQIIVLDGPAKKIHYFENMKFLKTEIVSNHLGRLPFFKALKNGSFLLWEQEYRDKVPFSLVYLTDKDFATKTILLEFEDTMFKRNAKKGWNYDPTSSRPVVFADYHSDHIIVGDSNVSMVRIFDLEGTLKREIAVTLIPQLVAQKDKDNINGRLKWIKPPHKAVWQEYKRLYDIAVPLLKNHTLIARYSPYEGLYDGIVYNGEGKPVGEYQGYFGEYGGFTVQKTGVLLFHNDENGDFSIKLAKPILKEKSQSQE